MMSNNTSSESKFQFFLISDEVGSPTLTRSCFCRMFRKDSPFKYDSEGVYANLDDMHVKIQEMEV